MAMVTVMELRLREYWSVEVGEISSLRYEPMCLLIIYSSLSSRPER
jgi:hypothetical protein